MVGEREHIIAANLGDDRSLEMVKYGYSKGLVSKEDFASALRRHQTAIDATKSSQRGVATEFAIRHKLIR
jgi:hypothetical protein